MKVVSEGNVENCMHYCLNCGVFLGFRGFCSKQCHNKWYDEMWEVSELMKTLKDLKSITEERIEEEPENNGYASAVGEITTELCELAKQWIKKLRNVSNIHDESITMNNWDKRSVEEFIMKFFDLSEKDLK